MPTRRQAIIGLGAAATGGAVVSAGAFSSSVAAEADMRVVVVSEFRLVAAREDGAYVDADAEGDPVEEILIEELNRNALSEFGGIVRALNDGDLPAERLTFSFEAAEDRVADALAIVAEEGVTETDGRYVLTPEGGLGPGEGVEFGLSVDLLPEGTSGLSDLPESAAEIELTITAEG